jgi:membrane protein implicated in regulation of membrane protease activity
VCAAVSGFMFRLWLRLDALERASVWKLYGWFTALLCAGCVTAAVSYFAWSQWLSEYHASDRSNKNAEEAARAVRAYARVRDKPFVTSHSPVAHDSFNACRRACAG